MKKTLFGLVLVGILVPSITFGASNDVVRSNIVSKLIEVLTAQINALNYINSQTKSATNPDEFEAYLDKAQLHANQSIEEIAVLLNPNGKVFGNVAPTTNTNNSQPTEEAYKINVTVEFGRGSWEVHNRQCDEEQTPTIAGYDCDNRYLDGMVKFTIDKPFQRTGKNAATVEYWPTNNPSNKVHVSFTNTEGASSAVKGFFMPNTNYSWKVIATSPEGKVAEDSGTFKTGNYPN